MKVFLTRICFTLWMSGVPLLGITGCVQPSFMGISMPNGNTAPEIQALAKRAKMGDKWAQLELGRRFEEGNGVPVDKRRATHFYRRAASDSRETIWVYSPPPGNGAPGRVVPVEKGVTEFGLEEARQRLSEIAQSEERQR